MVHCNQRGCEIISGDNGHTFRFEQGRAEPDTYNYVILMKGTLFLLSFDFHKIIGYFRIH